MEKQNIKNTKNVNYVDVRSFLTVNINITVILLGILTKLINKMISQTSINTLQWPGTAPAPSNNDEKAYLEKVEDLSLWWCRLLNIAETKELVLDFEQK